MPPLPVSRRKYQTFISHAHADKEIVDQIANWLISANVKVWYDSTDLPAGTQISTFLGEAIEQCQTMIIVLSKSSVESGWVKDERETAHYHRNQFKGFRIIPIRIEECEVPSFLQTTKWIDLVDGSLDLSTAHELLHSIYYADIQGLDRRKDIFVSRSWREYPETEPELANFVCKLLDEHGFRLIGDKEDQPSYEEDRIKTIIKSCGASAAILPDRGDGKTSKYMLREIAWADEMGLPLLVVAEDTVELPPELEGKTIRIKRDEIANHDLISKRIIPPILDFADEWQQPIQPHYVFYGTNFDFPERTDIVRTLIETVTAIPCKIGENLREKNIQNVICNDIQNAFFMIADITQENLNTCIEAGIARGANVNLHLIAEEPRRSPPFMFRDMQVEYYENDIQLLSHIHRIVQPYRRRVMNYELATNKW